MINSVIKPTLIISAIAFVAALLITHVKEITYPRILELERNKQQGAIDMVLPGYTISKTNKLTIDDSELVYWVGEKEENGTTIKAYAYISVNYGYSGDVKTMVGINDQGIIIGISVIQQTETPGLGARVTEKASSETVWGSLFGGRFTSDEITTPWFQEQFRGIDLNKKIKIVRKGDWRVELKDELLKGNEISSITGATITTKAVVKSIQKGEEMMRKAGIINITEKPAGEVK